MKKELFLALVILIVTQSAGRANYNSSLWVSRSPQSHFSTTNGNNPYYTGANNFTNPFRTISKSNKQSLSNVTLLITNSFGNDFDLLVASTTSSDYYFINIHPNQYQAELTIPEGTYDITFFPDDMGINHHYYTVGCDYSGGGIGTYAFWGVNITSAMSCNTIYIE